MLSKADCVLLHTLLHAKHTRHHSLTLSPARLLPLSISPPPQIAQHCRCARDLIPRPLKNADEIQKNPKNQELHSKTIEKR